MNAEDRRVQRLQMLDDEIGRALRAAEASGELRAAPSFGRPMPRDEGYEQTPAELRLGFKILKDAGVLPAEVQWMRDIAALESQLRATPAADTEAVGALRRRLTEMRQQLALRLEKLRHTGSL